MKEELVPKSWLRCAFGDVAKIRNGFAFKSSYFKKVKEEFDDVPLVRQSQLKRSKVDLSEAVYLSAHFLLECPNYIVRRGDILIGMSGSIGKVCQYDEDTVALQNQRTGKIEVISGHVVDSKFLGLFLSTFERQLVEKAKGMGVQNISAKDIEQLPFPLPPLAEQKRIVAKIEELFSELDTGEESLRHARRQLSLYRQSLLKQAFEGKLTAAWRKEHEGLVEKWSYPKVTEVTERVSKIQPANNPQKEIRYLDISGIDNARQQVVHVKSYLGSSAPSRARQLVKHGDILFSTVRTYLKNIAIVPSEYDGQVASTGFSVLRPSNKVLSRYIFAYTLTPMFLDPLAALQRGSSYPAVRDKDVRSQKIPLPSLPEQHEIVRILDEQFAVIEENERELDAALARSAALRQSILRHAFTGKLVPQDPTDEPASELLARIREKRKI